jgi:hypothetical protein
MTFLGSVLSITAFLFLGAMIAGSWLCARLEICERQAMGLQWPEEVH